LRAQDIDLKKVTSVLNTSTHGYGRFNPLLARTRGHSLKPKTKALCTPLIDMVSSDPDTMMSAMFETQKLTLRCGQIFTVFTADQQLYHVMVNVMWVHPELFPNFYPRLGGMHMLMSFVVCAGVLMANSGHVDVLRGCLWWSGTECSRFKDGV